MSHATSLRGIPFEKIKEKVTEFIKEEEEQNSSHRA